MNAYKSKLSLSIASLILLPLLAACQPSTIGTSAVGYNHRDKGIEFTVNKQAGSYVQAHKGGGGFSCCVSIPAPWQPGLTTTVWDGTLGAATARWGADRINWGIIQVFNALHRYITEQTAPLISDDDARILANTLSQTRLFEGTFRRILFDAVSYRLERAIAASQRKVKSINIAVFGFSRGAAQARAFVHWLFEIVQPWNNGCGHNLAGVPMQLSFLGLFDTVASVGISNMLRITDGRYAWASDDLMSIHPDVQKCAHFVALHEQRINFPVEHDSYLAARADHPERREEWLRNGGRGMPPPVPISGLSPTFMFASDLRELFETVHRRVAVPPAATTLFDRYVHDSLAGFYIADWTELNAPVGATNGYLRYRTVYNASSQKQQQVCVDPLTTPTPPRAPPMGQWFPRI